MWFCGAQCAYWNVWAWHPPVGVWIGILGLLGVLVPLIRDLNKISEREKALWTVVLFALLLLELKSVYQDRNEHDQQQAEARERETTSFESIANRIEGAIQQSQTHFAATMQKSDAIMGRVGDSIKAQTGGDSFAFITFTAEPAQAFEMHWNSLLAPRGEPYFLVSVTSHGKYPLRGTQAIMMDDESRLAAMREYNKHPSGDWIKAINSADSEYQMTYLRPQSTEAPQGEVDVIGVYPMPKGDSKRLTINFSAPNGYWNELLHLGRVNGTWHQCLSLMGPTEKQVKKPFIWCSDRDWPEGRALAEKDWTSDKPKVQ